MNRKPARGTPGVRRTSKTKDCTLSLDERLALVLQSSCVTVTVQDNALRYTTIHNPGNGIFTDEILGRTDAEFFSGASADSLIALKERAIRDAAELTDDVPIVWENTKRWLRIAARPCPAGSDGEPRLICAITDITQQKEAEERIRYQAGLLDHLTDAVIATDLDLRINYWNPAAERQYGWTRQEILGRRFSDIITLEYVGCSREAAGRTMKADGSWQGEVTQNRKDGSRFPVHVVVSLVRDANGTPTGYISLNRDISSVKRTEHALAQSHHRLAEAQRIARVGSWEADFQAGTVTWSDEMYRIYGVDKNTFGHTVKELIGLVHPDDRPILQRSFSAVASGTPDTAIREFRIVTPAGAIRHVAATSEAVYDAAGRPIRVVGTTQDITDRKQTEERMRLLAHTLESVSEIATITDLDNNLIFVNDAFLRIYGYTHEEVIGRNINFVWSPNNRPRLLEEILQNSHDGVWSGEILNVTKTGREFPLYLRTSQVKDEHGVVIALAGISEDITERKRADEALRKSEERHRLISTVASDYMFSTTLMPDGSLGLEWVAGAFEEMTGYSYEEYVRMGGWRAAVYPEDRNIDDRDMETLETNRPVASELRTLTKDGSVVWVKVYAHPVWDEERGRLIGIFGAVKDITERKRAEEALRENERRLKDAQRLAKIGSWENHLSARRLIWSDEMYRIFGYPPGAELTLEMITEVFPPEELKKFQAAVQAAIEENIPYSQDYRIVRPDGSVRYVHDEGELIRNSAGMIDWMVGTTQDITERKTAEQEREKLQNQLLQAQKLESIGVLASGIAHDFNNILNAIMGNASLIEADPGNIEKLNRRIASILKSSERGAELVKQLLTIARKAHIERRETDVNDLLIEMVRLMNETFPKTIAIETDLTPSLPSIELDPNQIHQVLLNLCVNARDAMPDGGTIRVSTAPVRREALNLRFPEASAATYIEISVRDSGPGIPEETRKRIFEPFFTTKEHGKGTGLGLSVALGILQNHSGFIDVQNEPGGGADFRFYLPAELLPAGGAEIPEPALKNAGRGVETLLFVEDEPIVRELAVEVLTDRGYSVITANTGPEGLERFREHRREIALVVSDYGLPGFDGAKLFAQLKAIDPGVRFMLATGFIEPEIKEELLDQGMLEITHKPYRFAELTRVIRKLLDEKRV